MVQHAVGEALPEVVEFLGSAPVRGVIGGLDAVSAHGETLTTIDPGSKTPLATVFAMQPDDVDRAVKAAARAFTSGWGQMAPNERGVLLHRLADAVETRKPIIAQIEALDAARSSPRPRATCRTSSTRCATTRTWRCTSSAAARWPSPSHEAWTVRQPWGPCGFIFPWNFPILLVGWGISPALAAGNTVVIKPAEDTPLSTIYLARLAKEVGHSRRRDQRRARARQT